MPSPSHSPNERLRAVLVTRAMCAARLAEEMGVDAKTVERWIATGRTPHARHRQTAARVLG